MTAETATAILARRCDARRAAAHAAGEPFPATYVRRKVERILIMEGQWAHKTRAAIELPMVSETERRAA